MKISKILRRATALFLTITLIVPMLPQFSLRVTASERPSWNRDIVFRDNDIIAIGETVGLVRDRFTGELHITEQNPAYAYISGGRLTIPTDGRPLYMSIHPVFSGMLSDARQVDSNINVHSRTGGISTADGAFSAWWPGAAGAF